MDYSNQNGFTLIEVMLALTILAAVLIPMLFFYVNSIVVLKETDIREKALSIAQQTMEHLKITKYDNLELKAADLSDTLTETEYPELSLDNYPDFSRKVTITTLEANLKKVTVLISWHNGNKNVELGTLKTRR